MFIGAICVTTTIIVLLICSVATDWQKRALEHDKWSREKKIEHQQWLVAAELSQKPKPHCEEE